MTNGGRAFTSAVALLIWCVAATLASGYFAGVWPLPDPTDVRYIGFHDRDALDSHPVNWARSYSKVDLPDSGWRPLRVAFDLIAPPGSTQPVVVEIGMLDSIQRRTTIGSAWTSEEVVIRDQPTGRRFELQLWSSVREGSRLGVGVRAVRQRPMVVSRRGAALVAGACVFGFVAWVATSRRRQSSAVAIVGMVGPVFRPLGPGIAMVLVGFVPMAWLGLAGRHVWWLWASFLILAAFGRLMRVLWLERSGETFPLFRDPVLELALGLSGAVSALYGVSFVVKRIGRLVSPLDGFFPLLFGGVLLIAWVVFGRRDTPRARALTWTRVDGARLGAFFLLVAWLAGPHLNAIHAYSSDPLQHIGWTNQVRLHGFVPDNYADTSLLISYPMGFASYAYVVTAFTPLAPGNGVNTLPVLASAMFLYTLVFGIRALQDAVPSRVSRWREVLDFGVYAALAAIFSSAQFGMWHYFEGTGRSAASLVHLIPLAVLMDALWRLRSCGANPGGTSARGGMLVLSGVLVLLINPGQLLVHGVITAAALAIETAWLVARGARRAISHAAAGIAGALLLSVATLTADPYWYRAIARAAGRQVNDAHIQKIDADFLQRFREPACLSAGCITSAVGRVNKIGSLLQPMTAFLWAPVTMAGRAFASSPPENAIDVAYSFPPPVHGAGIVLQGLAVLAFLMTIARHRWSFSMLILVLLTAAGVDLTVRRVLGELIGPGDPTLRLLTPYASRAASVFFNQAVWGGLAAGVFFAIVRWTTGSRRWAPVLVVWLAVIGGVWYTAARDLQAESARVTPTPAVPTLDDLWDFHAIERVVPHGESYLVTARVLFGNNERYVDPIDEAVTLYAQADRPTLFEFFQSYGAQYSAADYLNVCAALKEGVRYPEPIVRSRARWVVMLSSSLLDPPIHQKWFCDEAVTAIFPRYESVARRGRLTLYRLW